MNSNSTVRIILNGKKASLAPVRQAIFDARKLIKHDLQVRTTWEYGDTHRLVKEAVAERIPRLIVGGGDGSVNEIADALAHLPEDQRPQLGIMPLGTANDFATACLIPSDLVEALTLAASGQATAIDLGRCNDRHFVNVAAGGFGAQVTADTPVDLKNFLGGSAYTLTGLVKALNFIPYAGRIECEGQVFTSPIVVGAVCNGRQAGGGQKLAPYATINDGLLDMVMLTQFPLSQLDTVVREVLNPDIDGIYVKRFQAKSLSYYADDSHPQPAPLNLDGEPYINKELHFDVVPAALKVVLPTHCPALKETSG